MLDPRDGEKAPGAGTKKQWFLLKCRRTTAGCRCHDTEQVPIRAIYETNMVAEAAISSLAPISFSLVEKGYEAVAVACIVIVLLQAAAARRDSPFY
ncbi:hypothetical protein GCM10027343_16640 [Noviherbaspirillum agri]